MVASSTRNVTLQRSSNGSPSKLSRPAGHIRIADLLNPYDISFDTPPTVGVRTPQLPPSKLSQSPSNSLSVNTIFPPHAGQHPHRILTPHAPAVYPMDSNTVVLPNGTIHATKSSSVEFQEQHRISGLPGCGHPLMPPGHGPPNPASGPSPPFNRSAPHHEDKASISPSRPPNLEIKETYDRADSMGHSTMPLLALDTEQGPTQIPLNLTAASKETDERRKRKLSAVHRFRQRQKEEVRETSQKIAELKHRKQELTENRDYLLVERDYLRSTISNEQGSARLSKRVHTGIVYSTARRKFRAMDP